MATSTSCTASTWTTWPLPAICKAARGLFASISLGVKSADYATVDRLCRRGRPEYITIDIAHGHAESVQKMIAYLKAKIPRRLRHRRQRGHARGGD